jgi:flagellar basal body-associated protein FliL
MGIVIIFFILAAMGIYLFLGYKGSKKATPKKENKPKTKV